MPCQNHQACQCEGPLITRAGRKCRIGCPFLPPFCWAVWRLGVIHPSTLLAKEKKCWRRKVTRIRIVHGIRPTPSRPPATQEEKKARDSDRATRRWEVRAGSESGQTHASKFHSSLAFGMWCSGSGVFRYAVSGLTVLSKFHFRLCIRIFTAF